jgi:hydroxyproline O-galactosyltransferase HPGT
VRGIRGSAGTDLEILMQIREGPRRSAPTVGALRSPMTAMMLAMFATVASVYVTGQ